MAGKKGMVSSSKFKEGNKAGKGSGRPPSTPEEKAIKKLTRTRFNNIVRRYLNVSLEKLEEILDDKDKQLTVLDSMVLSVMNKAMLEGDEKKLNWFLEQLFGKIAENSNVTVTGANGGPVSLIDYSKVSDAQLKVLLEVAKAGAVAKGDEDED